MNRALQLGYSNLSELDTQKEFDNVRSDARFSDVVKRANINAYPCMGNGIAIRLEDGVMPGWNIVNLYMGVKMKFMSVTASAQNIFDTAYRTYGSGVDGYGRNFWITTTIQF